MAFIVTSYLILCVIVCLFVCLFIHGYMESGVLLYMSGQGGRGEYWFTSLGWPFHCSLPATLDHRMSDVLVPSRTGNQILHCGVEI